MTEDVLEARAIIEALIPLREGMKWRGGREKMRSLMINGLTLI